MAAKVPDVVKACDDPKWKPNPKGGPQSRAECRKAGEMVYCAAHPTDPWCKEQRERRARDAQILVIGGAVFLLLVWLDPGA